MNQPLFIYSTTLHILLINKNKSCLSMIKRYFLNCNDHKCVFTISFYYFHLHLLYKKPEHIPKFCFFKIFIDKIFKKCYASHSLELFSSTLLVFTQMQLWQVCEQELIYSSAGAASALVSSGVASALSSCSVFSPSCGVK